MNRKGLGKGIAKAIAKATAFVMATIMTLGFVPVQAVANSTGNDRVYTINLGNRGFFAGIASPSNIIEEPPIGEEPSIVEGLSVREEHFMEEGHFIEEGLSMEVAMEWDGSRVYFGVFQGRPLLWRVLNNRIGSAVGTSAILMQCDSIVAHIPVGVTESLDDERTIVSRWEDSFIRGWLNSTEESQFLADFSDMEKDSLYGYTKNEAPAIEWDRGGQFTNPALIRDQVFLLSAEEALNPTYGFSTPESRMLKNHSTGRVSSWWLRSFLYGEETETIAMEEAITEPVTSEESIAEAIIRKAAVINESGELAVQNIFQNNLNDEIAGIAPAVCLDTSSILFTTPAVGGKPNSLEKVREASTVKEWKLTLKDESINLFGMLVGITDEFERNDTIHLHHLPAANLENATQVSAIIMDIGGTPVYYGRINDNPHATESMVTVPADMDSGSYRLYIFAEAVNGDYHTDYASALGRPINLIISQTETPKIITVPTIQTLTYGQKLEDSTLSGGEVYSGTSPVSGTFQWVDSFVVPNVSDGDLTGYRMQFIPEDSLKYNSVTIRATLTVEMAENPPNIPENDMEVEYRITKVEQVPLPEGWDWLDEDREKEIPIGGEVHVQASYHDIWNYYNTSITVAISRMDCNHNVATQTRDEVAATCTEKGYTGDIYCIDCGQKLSDGESTQVVEHSFMEIVTRQPTVEKEGSKTYICLKCDYEYIESIPRHVHDYGEGRTIRMPGCELKGEIQYSCDCEDFYIVTEAALGHDFKEGIIVQPTTVREGIKAFTCSRCGYQYMESIPKLSIGGNIPGTGENFSGIGGNIPGTGENFPGMGSGIPGIGGSMLNIDGNNHVGTNNQGSGGGTVGVLWGNSQQIRNNMDLAAISQVAGRELTEVVVSDVRGSTDNKFIVGRDRLVLIVAITTVIVAGCSVLGIYIKRKKKEMKS